MGKSKAKSESSRKTSKKESTVNTKKRETTAKKEKSNKPNQERVTAFFVPAFVALVSLCAGIISPALWQFYQQEQQLNKALLPRRSLQKTTRYECDDLTLSDYLHEYPVAGMHVVCIQETSITFFQNAQLGDAFSNTIPIPGGFVNDWSGLKALLVSKLKLRSQDRLHQAWSTFSPTGKRLLDESDPEDSSIENLSSLGLFLVFQGGQWIWPGIRKGYQRDIVLDSARNATLETLSTHPLVLSVKGFLSVEECDLIQEMAAPKMEYSKVTLMDKDKGRPASDFRTSQTTFLASSTPELQDVDRRTASLVRIPASHQESAQVLRYGNTEKYDTHHDYFDPSLYKKDPGVLRMTQHGRNNRMATVFWYLSDVESGGETVFPRYDKAPQPRNMQMFHAGLKVKPERGKVIIFYSLTPDGNVDPLSLHGAAPVRGKDDVKWAANKWVWNAPMKF